jgi:hypothetical protein
MFFPTQPFTVRIRSVYSKIVRHIQFFMMNTFSSFLLQYFFTVREINEDSSVMRENLPIMSNINLPEGYYLDNFVNGLFSQNFEESNLLLIRDRFPFSAYHFTALLREFCKRFLVNSGTVQLSSQEMCSLLLNFVIDPSKIPDYQKAVHRITIEYSTNRQYCLYKGVYLTLSTEYSKKLALKTSHLPSSSFDTKTSELSAIPNPKTYGEIEFPSFLFIFQWIKREISQNPILSSLKNRENLVFTDLGHGTGKALIITASIFHQMFSHVYGIEFLYGLYEESIKRIDQYHATVKETKEKDFDFQLFHNSHLSVTPYYGNFLENSHFTYNEEKQELNTSIAVSFDWTTSGECRFLLPIVVYFLSIRCCFCSLHLFWL